MNIIGKKYIWFAISLAIMVPGIISLILFGLNLSIDFTGGSRMTVAYPKEVESKQIEFIKNNLESQKIKVVSIEQSDKLLIIRTSPIEQKQNVKFIKDLKSNYKEAKQEEFSTIGPTIGKETTVNAVKA